MADNDQLKKPLIQVIVILFSLAVINAIVVSVLGNSTLIPGLYQWSIATIISAVIATIMIIILLRFVNTIGPIIQEQYPKFLELRIIVINIVYLVCLFIAYGAYRILVSPFLPSVIWLYDIAFLALGLYLAYIIVSILLKTSDKWSDAILHNVKQATGEIKVCNKCETNNPISNKFCDKCGSRLV